MTKSEWDDYLLQEVKEIKQKQVEILIKLSKLDNTVKNKAKTWSFIISLIVAPIAAYAMEYLKR